MQDLPEFSVARLLALPGVRALRRLEGQALLHFGCLYHEKEFPGFFGLDFAGCGDVDGFPGLQLWVFAPLVTFRFRESRHLATIFFARLLFSLSRCLVSNFAAVTFENE